MLAISIGKHFNVTTNNIKKAIESYIPTNNRSEIIKTSKNTIILMHIMLILLACKKWLFHSQEKIKNKICILGDMLNWDILHISQEIIKLVNNWILKLILLEKNLKSFEWVF